MNVFVSSSNSVKMNFLCVKVDLTKVAYFANTWSKIGGLVS